MDMSVDSASSSPEGLQGAIQVSLMKKAQDMATQQMQTLMQSIKAVSPTHLGGKIDLMA
jgi:hypothetical protein